MRAKVIKHLFSREHFLLLLPLFFVFHGYTENYPLINKYSALKLLFTYAAGFIPFSLLFYFIYKSWRKASAFTFIVMCSFFFFGSFHDLLKRYFDGTFITKYTLILPFLLIFYIAAFFFVKKVNINRPKSTGYLNSLLLLLVLLDLGQLVFFKKTNKAVAGALVTYTKCDTCDKPDIYFIIADEYIGNKTLREQFNYDNSLFENELRKRGFHIVANSIGNYNYTPYSVASILSMDYLKGITHRSNDNKNRNISYKTINKNDLIQFLSSQGYSIINHSLFDLAGQSTTVNSMFFLTKEKLITSQTLLGRLDRDIRFNLVTRFKIYSEIKRSSMGTLENNQKLLNDTYATLKTRTSVPKFVYTHLMMPHYPYYFDHTGRPYSLDSLAEGNQSNKQQYVEYLQYCNKIFLPLLDTILQNSKKPPIIIFMGDHGFRHFTEPTDDIYQFLNLNAIYLPHKNYSGFHNGISAVNQFRVILNTEFKQSFPLLKDSTIYLKEY